MNALELTGRTKTHLVPVDAFDTFLQLQVWEAFQDMAEAALEEGIQIKILSGFRDFERQLYLWNRKMLGKTPMLDRRGNAVDVSRLNEEERAQAVLAWLAIPGSSRHHWGTDIDVMDAMAVGFGYQVQLDPKEYLPGGVFNRMYMWLMQNANEWDFYFPYDVDRGGVAVEPWHISYGPKAQECLNQFESKMLAESLKGARIEGEAYLLENVDRLFHQYVKNVGQYSADFAG